MNIRFEEKELQGGKLLRGGEYDWFWIKNGGSYKKGINFFSVHWEIQCKYPNIIRFHVESPKYHVDSILNSIKSEFIGSILKDKEIEQSILASSFVYEIGKRISDEAIQQYKSTEAFKIKLKENQVKSDACDNIKAVHKILLVNIDKILEKFANRLKNDGLVPMIKYPQIRRE
jgi:hypothetical protein